MAFPLALGSEQVRVSFVVGNFVLAVLEQIAILLEYILNFGCFELQEPAVDPADGVDVNHGPFSVHVNDLLVVEILNGSANIFDVGLRNCFNSFAVSV